MVTASQRRIAQQRQIDRQIEKFRGGKISKEEAAKGVKRIIRGGGKGAAARAQMFKAAQAAEAKFKATQEAKAVAEARAKRVRAVAEARAKQIRQVKVRQVKTKTREQRIQELMQQNRQRGILTSRASATRVISSRISSEKREKTITVGEVQPRPKAKGFIKKSLRKLTDLQNKRSTASIRDQQRKLKNELELLGLTVGLTVISGVGAIIALPKTAVDLARNPSQLKKVPGAIKSGAEDLGQMIRVSPTEAFGKIAGEVVLLKGTGESLKVVGKVGNKASARLSPKFRGVKAGKIVVKTSKGKTTLKIGGTVKKISVPIKEQARLAGKKVTAVSAQAEEIVKFTKSKRIVRKPIPGEATLSKTTKKLLKRFDEGKITSKQLNILDDAIRKETKGAGSLLERSFFADPQARFRPSRLGLQEPKRASLIDILSGDVTFKANKPQILVFKDVKIQNFPKSLKEIAKKLKAGKPLTKSETEKFVRFQQKISGKFKPVGGLTREPEITLSPGEIIKKKKKIGVTLINGRKVSIVEAEVVKATKKTSQLLKKSKAGKITAKEIKELTKRLKKETGFKSSLSRGKIGKPRARITTKIPRIRRTPRLVRGSAKARITMERVRAAKRTPGVSRRPITKTIRPSTTRAIRQVKGRAKPSRVARGGPRRGTRRRAARPLVKPPVAPPRKPSKVIRKKKPLKKPVQVFDVFGKSRGKFVKLNPKPLTRSDALSKGAFAIDRTTARTFKIVPKGKTKTPGALLKSERNYFNRQGFKLREFRIKKGRKFKLKNKYIEKGGHAIDSVGERSGLSLRRHLQQRRKAIAKVKSKRKITPTQRKVMLANLKKARSARKKNLKGGKRK